MTQNLLPHPGPAGWPGDVAAAMNVTLAAGWAFHAASRRAYAAAAAGYGGGTGGARLRRDAAELGRLRRALVAACPAGPEP